MKHKLKTKLKLKLNIEVKLKFSMCSLHRICMSHFYQIH